MSCVIVGKSVTCVSVSVLVKCGYCCFPLVNQWELAFRESLSGEGSGDSQRARAQRCFTGRLISAALLTCMYCLFGLCDKIHVTFKIFKVSHANFGSLWLLRVLRSWLKWFFVTPSAGLYPRILIFFHQMALTRLIPTAPPIPPKKDIFVRWISW